MTGKLVEPTVKSGAKNAELPKYNPETEEITFEGVTQKAPSGTKFVMDDGTTYVLHHARTVVGGWKKSRPAAKKPAATAPAAKK